MTTSLAAIRLSASRELAAAGLVLLVSLALVTLFQSVTSGEGNLQDFVEYWAAGRLNASGENPYDADRMFRLEKEASPQLTEAIMMWNPPWTLALAMPFGALSAAVGHWLWLCIQLAILLGCADWIWRFYGGAPTWRWLAWVVVLAFVPTYFLVRMGQIGPVVLLGIVGFLHFERQRMDARAGASLALAAVKPHLVLLFGAGVLLWAIAGRRWRAIAGAVLGVSALTAYPLLYNPALVGEYWQAMTHQPPQMLSPTLGTLLRLALGVEHFWLQFVPTALGLAWLSWHWYRRRRTWKWSEQAPLLLVVSFLTAPYGAWPFDYVVLSIALIQATVWVVENLRWETVILPLTVFLGFDALALCFRNVHYAHYYWYAWMAPLLLYGYLVSRRQALAA